jgi:hypothetical protein
MKKLIFAFFLICAINSLMAQTQDSNVKIKKGNQERLIPFKSATITTQNGEAIITFERAITDEYTIFLTPYSGKTTLYIFEKTAEKVVIKTANKSDMTFDYIIFIKKRRVVKPSTE